MTKEMKIIPPEGYEVDEENSTFECIKFKPIEPQLPKTWEEFCETHPVKPGECYIGSGAYSDITKINHENIRKALPMTMLPSLEDAKAMLALCQLIQLRDCYNNGWQPDWNNNKQYKWCINFCKQQVIKTEHSNISHVLAFKTSELRNKFLENFKDLIETAKPLL